MMSGHTLHLAYLGRHHTQHDGQHGIVLLEPGAYCQNVLLKAGVVHVGSPDAHTFRLALLGEGGGHMDTGLDVGVGVAH